MDTKALRQKILDLAIRGKLVPQDPNDEPASVLLERIRAQKQQMVKEGKLKAKDIKNDTIIFKGEDSLHYEKFPDGSIKCIEDEIPFEIPQGWEWCRLSHVGITNIGLTYSPSDISEDGVIVLRSSNIVDGKIDLHDLVRVRAPIPHNRFLHDKDILICARNGSKRLVGKCAIIEGISEPVSFGAFMAIYRSEFNQFIYYFLNTDTFRNTFCSDDTKQINQLTQNIIKRTLLPLPPQVEQIRITNQLGKVIPTIENIERDRNHIQRIIKSLKSHILDLAIRGKLVAQDPNDEPASVLLKRIRAEKEKLIKQGKIKRDKKESVIFKSDDNSYYLKTGRQLESIDDWDVDILPNNWELCCLGELCDYGNCVKVETADIDDSAWILDLEDIEKDTGKILQKVTKKQRNSISTKHRFHSGQVLYSKLRPYLNKVVLTDEDGYCTSEILPLDFAAPLLSSYARYYLMSPTFLAYADRCSYGVKMPRLSTKDGKKAVITVPPLSEQQRIVTLIEIFFDQLNNIAQALS